MSYISPILYLRGLYCISITLILRRHNRIASLDFAGFRNLLPGPETTPVLPFTQRDREGLQRTPVEPPHPHNGHLLSRKTLKQTMIKYLVS